MGFYFLGTIFMFAAVGTVAVWLAGNALGFHQASAQLRVGSVALLVLLFFGLGGGGRLLRRVARPVGDIVEAARRVEAGDLTARVVERGPRDVRSVARAFNAMSDQLEQTDARRRRFLADVTHELRTPLAVIRGRAEGILEGVYPGDAAHVGPILESARTLEALIEDLRTLAMAEAGGLTLNRETVDLAQVLGETAALFSEAARDAGVTLTTATGIVPPIQADPARLQSVFSNLITNALRHTPRGGTVAVGAREEAGGVAVTVTDSGEGIAPELLPRVFERFAKGSGPSGSGLGLAIARDLVVAHGGRIAAENGAQGGATVTAWLPV